MLVRGAGLTGLTHLRHTSLRHGTLRHTGTASTTSATSTTSTASHDKVHKSHWVLLNNLIELGLLLLEHSHKLLVKLGILDNSLAQGLELRVLSESSQVAETRTIFFSFLFISVHIFVSISTHGVLATLGHGALGHHTSTSHVGNSSL
jgi:hypothetical protein